MADKPLLTVCIVTYNSESHIGNVLSSLYKSTVAPWMQVMVVDNASTDGTVSIVETGFPDVHLVCLPQNIGFGQGHNKALPYLNAPYHLIVNPDITFEPDVLEKMVGYLDGCKDAVMLTPRVLHPDGSEQFLPKEMPSIHFLLSGYLERLGQPFTGWRGKYTWRDKEHLEPVELHFATGCFMLVRASAFREAGGFDPRYFMYMEDSDLTLTMKAKGLTLYHPGYSVTHVWARENVRSIRGTLMHVRSIIKFFNKHGWRL